MKDKGRFALVASFCVAYTTHSILEYSNREDATLAIKELDGKELRGRPVRIALDPSVCNLNRNPLTC